MTTEATNTPVAAETTISSKANSAVTFSDLEQMDQAEQREAHGGKKRAPQKESKEKVEKDETGSRAPADGAKEKPKAKAEKPKAADKADVETDAEDEPEGSEKDKGEAKPRAKAHRFRSGDEEISVGGDSVVRVPIDGKMEEVPLQEVLNSYSGKVQYDRKFSELAADKKTFQESRQKVDSMISNLLEKAQSSPDEGWSFLAELVGKDPVEFRTDLLRKQREEARVLSAMDDDEFEKFIKDQSLTWREKRLERKDQESASQRATAEAQERRATVTEQFGIDDGRYDEVSKVAREHLGGTEPSVEQVVYAERYMSALEAVKEAVPHLAEHPKFDSIMEDVVQDMLRDPKLRKERVAAILKEVWGEAEQPRTATRRLSEKVRRDEGEPARKPEKSRDAVLWDDI